MPTTNQVLVNPNTGDTYQFLETAKDTKGRRVTMLATIHSKGRLVPNHMHVLQEESFEIISGKLTIWTRDSTSTLRAGDRISFPANTPHNHFNPDDVPVVYKHSVSPAFDFDYLIETLIGLAADKKSKNGKYSLMQQLVTLKYLDSKTFLADIPVPVQKMLMNTLAPLGRLMGFRAIYKKYSGIEK